MKKFVSKNSKSVLYLQNKIILLFVFTLLTVSLMSCSKNSKTKTETVNINSSDYISSDYSSKIIMGFSQIGSESAWRSRNTASIFEAAAESNIQIIYDDAQQKQSNQIKAIRSFIVYQVDIIAFVPIVEDGWDNVLQEAKEANIPVIIVDRQIKTDPSLYTAFIGENSFDEGFKAGTFLLEKCAEENRNINILELYGTRKSSVADGRAAGFREVIKSDQKYNIIGSQNGDFLRSRGREIANSIIEENDTLKINNQNIDVIFSHNDSMTLGLLDSLENNGISTDDIIIITIDAEQESINALTQGKLNCVVECNPNLGPKLMDLATRIVKGRPFNSITYMEEIVFSEKDDFSTYSDRGY